MSEEKMLRVNYKGNEYKITPGEQGEFRCCNLNTNREYIVNPEKQRCTCAGFVYNKWCRHLSLAEELGDKMRSNHSNNSKHTLENFYEEDVDPGKSTETRPNAKRDEVVFMKRKEDQKPPQREEIEPIQVPIHEPVMSEDEALELFNKAEKLAKSLLERGKHVLFIGDHGVPVDPSKEHGRPYITANGWKRIARVFGVSTDILSVEREDEKNGHFSYRVTVRASKGRCSDVDVGIVSSRDKLYSRGGKIKPEEIDPKNVCLKAVTQAKGRAIRSFFAFLEPTAEEMV